MPIVSATGRECTARLRSAARGVLDTESGPGKRVQPRRRDLATACVAPAVAAVLELRHRTPYVDLGGLELVGHAHLRHPVHRHLGAVSDALAEGDGALLARRGLHDRELFLD